MYDVFVSHNKNQKPWVREFCKILRENNLNVFFDEDSISPGASVISVLENAIQNSRYVVFIISQESINSKWVAMETALAAYEDPDASNNVIVPVVLEKVDAKKIRYSIRALNAINLTDSQTRDCEFQRLLKHLGCISNASKCPINLIDNDNVSNFENVGLKIANIYDVLSWGWDGKKLLEELIRIDYQTIENLNDEHEGHVNQWDPVFMDNPETWRILIESPQNIVGYWHFVPLFDDEFKLVKQGSLLDSAITSDKVKMFIQPGYYNIYFSAICILPNYRKYSTTYLLLNSILDVFAILAKQGIFIKEVSANAYTPSGISFCKSLGFKYLRDHVSHGKIFVAKNLSLLNSPLVQKNHTELINLYSK